MTLFETLEDESTFNEEMDELLLGAANAATQEAEESKFNNNVSSRAQQADVEFFERSSTTQVRNRRPSVRTPAIAGLKRQLTEAKKNLLFGE